MMRDDDDDDDDDDNDDNDQIDGDHTNFYHIILYLQLYKLLLLLILMKYLGLWYNMRTRIISRFMVQYEN